ncbi:MAG TPA: GyrI-like domain-containing protein [Gaiellaceae bacterium]|nr:GyrI-like domain-containing protein [Gaiellaceae bacterium]
MEPEVERAQPVERDPTPVMFVRCADEIAEMQATWARFEELVGLRGRKFYGAYDPLTKEYRVCAELREGDDPTALGVEAGELPGGRYLRARLRGEPPAVYERIGPTFTALVRRATPDESRPSIEFYRRHDEIDLLLPVASE